MRLSSSDRALSRAPLFTRRIKWTHSLTARLQPRGEWDVWRTRPHKWDVRPIRYQISSLTLQSTVVGVWGNRGVHVIIHDMGRVVTLERRIKELCNAAVATKDEDALGAIMDELQSSL